MSEPGSIPVSAVTQARRPGLLALLLTGYAGDGAAIAVDGAVTGSFSLVRKPVRPAHLVDRIEALLAERRKGR